MNKEDKKEKQVLKLTIDIPPSVNHYLQYRTVKKGNKYMAMSYKPKDVLDYQKKLEKYVKEEVKKQNWIMSDNKFQHYYIEAIIYFPRIDQDVNNYWKVVFDTITNTQMVWIDDTQAVERPVRIYYDSKNPRIEYKIYEVDYIGIFDNEEELNLFENNCLNCKRCKDGKCSILVKAKEGRIQEEVSEDKVCNKYSEVKSK